ncbi:TlpA disulfide reductase family protein [Nocardiopsis tropica]|uniref:TlpA disulfide reductase family protein n=1 Tax=Tsukamurella TaxID=2060 RepID=UPI00208070AF|nr:TlpA disulfide reductase family protein [Tsukamurella sp. TY48]GIZ96560.1 alkyl hydroperoxide reductase [Tsukamurella sp. TY48]
MTPGRRAGRRVAAALLVGMLALSGCTQYSDRSAEGGVIAPGGKLEQFYEPAKRSTVGDLSGRSVTDPNTTLSLKDYEGKVVVINVWGSWCAPCRIEAPELEKVYVASKPRGVEFLGINVRETAGDDAARDFIDSFKLTYPSIYDPPGKTLLAIGEQYPTTVVPMTFVLDKQHRVAAVYLTTVGEKELTGTLDKVLGEQ